MIVHFQPVYPLAFYVSSAYYMKVRTGFAVHEIIPDGKPSLMLNLNGEQHRLLYNNDVFTGNGNVFLGIHNGPVKCCYGEEAEMIIIRFYPHAIWSLTGIPGDEMLNNVCSSADLFGDGFKGVFDAIRKAVHPDEKLRIVFRFLDMEAVRARAAHPGLIEGLRAIHATGGCGRLTALSGNSYNKYKQLQRSFVKTTGIAPKTYSRMVRFDHIQQFLRTARNPDWFDVVARYGFADQSHLIKEFLAITNHTPVEYLNRRQDYFI